MMQSLSTCSAHLAAFFNIIVIYVHIIFCVHSISVIWKWSQATQCLWKANQSVRLGDFEVWTNWRTILYTLWTSQILEVITSSVLQPLQKLRELLAKPNKRLTLTAAEWPAHGGTSRNMGTEDHVPLPLAESKSANTKRREESPVLYS